MRGRVPAQLGAAVGLFGAVQVATLLQQPGQVERAGGVAALVRAAEGLLGAVQVVALLQQYAQAHRRRGVAELVGGAICRLCGRQIVTLFELDCHVERVIGIGWGGSARAGRHRILPRAVHHGLRHETG